MSTGGSLLPAHWRRRDTPSRAGAAPPRLGLRLARAGSGSTFPSTWRGSMRPRRGGAAPSGGISQRLNFGEATDGGSRRRRRRRGWSGPPPSQLDEIVGGGGEI